MRRASSYVLDLEAIDATQLALAGGKGASLGELSRVEGIRVPPGFCVTADAFRRIVAPAIEGRLDRLSLLDPDDREGIRTASEEIRRAIEAIAIPGDLAAAITGAVDERAAYAVRSSATAEDLPTASFAGQQDSYLNVVGPAAILEHVSRCWASLFTERAVSYRIQNGFDHRKVQMAVVVQRMVPAHAAGILFTADPVSSNRNVAAVEAVLGLGEALVSGLVNPDRYTVRDGEIVRQGAIAGEQAALTDAQAIELVQLGRRIEARFGRPQDIEWCLADDEFQIVQSRPITTLFPIPESGDLENHVYLSVGHQQMMTDPMKPLGLSVHQLIALPRMYEAGGRLFVDVAQRLASPAIRGALLAMIAARGAADGRRAADRRRPRLHPVGPGRGARGPAGRRRAAPARDRSGHRRRARREDPGLARRTAARDQHQVRPGAVRLHPRGHPGAEAAARRSRGAIRCS